MNIIIAIDIDKTEDNHPSWMVIECGTSEIWVSSGSNQVMEEFFFLSPICSFPLG